MRCIAIGYTLRCLHTGTVADANVLAGNAVARRRFRLPGSADEKTGWSDATCGLVNALSINRPTPSPVVNVVVAAAAAAAAATATDVLRVDFKRPSLCLASSDELRRTLNW